MLWQQQKARAWRVDTGALACSCPIPHLLNHPLVLPLIPACCLELCPCSSTLQKQPDFTVMAFTAPDSQPLRLCGWQNTVSLAGPFVLTVILNCPCAHLKPAPCSCWATSVGWPAPRSPSALGLAPVPSGLLSRLIAVPKLYQAWMPKLVWHQDRCQAHKPMYNIRREWETQGSHSHNRSDPGCDFSALAPALGPWHHFLWEPGGLWDGPLTLTCFLQSTSPLLTGERPLEIASPWRTKVIPS